MALANTRPVSGRLIIVLPEDAQAAILAHLLNRLAPAQRLCHRELRAGGRVGSALLQAIAAHRIRQGQTSRWLLAGGVPEPPPSPWMRPLASLLALLTSSVTSSRGPPPEAGSGSDHENPRKAPGSGQPSALTGEGRVVLAVADQPERPHLQRGNQSGLALGTSGRRQQQDVRSGGGSG